MDDHYVYRWTNLKDGKSYVGKGRRGRVYHHMRPFCDSLIAEAIRAEGIQNFSVTFLEDGLSNSSALSKEKFWISELNTMHPHGYNILGNDYSLTADHRSKISRALKGKVRTEAHSKALAESKKSLSAESRKRLSASAKARYKKEGAKEKHSEGVKRGWEKRRLTQT